MANANKLVQQQLKSILSTLNEEDLMKVFQQFLLFSHLQVEKQCKMISYKCFESSLTCTDKRANGYGRNEQEANVNCIRNLLEILLEDERIVVIFKECLKKFNNETTKQNIQSIIIDKQYKQNSEDIYNTQSFHLNQEFRNSIDTSEKKNKVGNFSQTHNNSVIQNATKQVSQELYQNSNEYVNTSTQNVQEKSYTHQTEASIMQNEILNTSYSNLQSSLGFPIQNNSNQKKCNTIEQFLTNSKTQLQKLNKFEENSLNNSINNSFITNQKHQRTKSMVNNGQAQQQMIQQLNTSQQWTSIQHQQLQQQPQQLLQQNNENGEQFSINNVAVNQSNKDVKYVQSLEEELKRSKNYIEHLERKIKLVMEENKILKSLLLENKKTKPNNQIQHIQNNENEPPQQLNYVNTQNTIQQQIQQNWQQQQLLQQQQQQQRSCIQQQQLINQNNNQANYTTQIQQPIINQQPQIQQVKNILQCTNQNLNIVQQQQQQQVQAGQLQAIQMNFNTNNQVIQDMSIDIKPIKQNGIEVGNTQIINQQSNVCQGPINNVNNDIALNILNNYQIIDKEKGRSQSVDINAKRGNFLTEASTSQLDTSMFEQTIQNNNSNLKNNKRNEIKKNIPRLNLQVLPNYHNKSNKSLNQYLLAVYQQNHKQDRQKI